MSTSGEIKTPTLDRLLEVRDEAQSLSSFMDWLEEQGFVLAGWPAHWFFGEEDDSVECWGSTANGECPWTAHERHGEPTHYPRLRFEGRNKLLHRYFEIDEAEADRERTSLLEHVRAQQGGKAL